LDRWQPEIAGNVKSFIQFGTDTRPGGFDSHALPTETQKVSRCRLTHFFAKRTATVLRLQRHESQAQESGLQVFVPTQMG